MAKYKYATVRGTKGINQQEDIADPVLELKDARNVWAPNGVIEQRPGYRGCLAFWPVFSDTGSIISNNVEVELTTPVVLKEATIGTVTASSDLSNLAVGSRWYFGFADYTGDTAALTENRLSALRINGFSNSNTNAVYAAVEYWNGTTWADACAKETVGDGNDFITGQPMLYDTAPYYNMVWPRDLATKVITASGTDYTKYWFRFTVQGNNGATAVDASAGTFSNTDSGAVCFTAAIVSGTTINIQGDFHLFKAEFPTNKRYISRFPTYYSSALSYGCFSTQSLTNICVYGDFVVDAGNGFPQGQRITNLIDPVSFAVIPQFGEAYSTQNYLPMRHPAFVDVSTIAAGEKIVLSNANQSAPQFSLTPQVESDDVIVGLGASYDKTTIEQLAEWPKSKYITFFRGELWAANFGDASTAIRWSAPAPYYKVWPLLNIEDISENDNSSITGIYGFGEHMYVFKNDSIWRMVDVGATDFALQSYAPQKVVSGVGCVSQASIVEVAGGLVFLAEGGIYFFDGNSAKRISDRVFNTLKRLNPARAAAAVGVNWKSRHCYLLAMSQNNSRENDIVFVWDYKNDSWWIWDNFNVSGWVLDEDASDLEALYYYDIQGSIYRVGAGNTNHGAAITSYIETQRLGYGNRANRLRTVEVTSNQTAQSVVAQVLCNDEVSGQGTSGTISFTDTNEKNYGTARYDEDNYTYERQRMKGLGFLKSGKWFNVRLTHSVKNTPWRMKNMNLGYVPIGRSI